MISEDSYLISGDRNMMSGDDKSWNGDRKSCNEDGDRMSGVRFLISGNVTMIFDYNMCLKSWKQIHIRFDTFYLRFTKTVSAFCMKIISTYP